MIKCSLNCMYPVWSWLHKFISLLIHAPTAAMVPLLLWFTGFWMFVTGDKCINNWSTGQIMGPAWVLSSWTLFWYRIFTSIILRHMVGCQEAPIEKDELSQFHHIVRVSLFCLAFFVSLCLFGFHHFIQCCCGSGILVPEQTSGTLGLIFSTVLLIHHQIIVLLCQVTFCPQLVSLSSCQLLSHVL